MSRYLEEAAELLRKAAEANEREHAGPETLRKRRMESARAFALLAAIKKGLLPQEVAGDVYGQFGGVR